MAARDIIKTTCPRDCYDACGIAVVRRDGMIAKVLGDPDHAISRGGLCGKCAIAYNGAWRDPTMRLQQPLRRVGAKGTSSFVPIAWDDALAEISARLGALAEAGEAARILHTHYTGTVGQIAGGFPLRFFHRLGATEVDPDTVCNKAGHLALELVFGSSVDGFDPRSIAESRTLVIWGANPSHSAPHQHRYWLREAQANGTKIIVVDPISHETARLADLHLKPRPGTDATLAFAWLHVLWKQGLVDHDFLSDHVLGAQELIPAIERTTTAFAARVCGIAESQIEAAALAYGAGPCLLWLGQGLQRQPDGGNIFRAIGALVAFTGNLAKPGAGFLYLNGAGNRGIDAAAITAPELARGTIGSVSHMDLASVLADPVRAGAFINWNNNPAASSPQQGLLRAALTRDDLFHVAIDLFHTDTTAYADIVLPAASFLEFDDLVLSYFDLTLSAQVKAAEPQGLALPNQEIFRRLARAMGFKEPALYESDADLIERLLRQTDYPGSFADLAAVGTVPLFATPRVQFADLRFATPSGKIELASARAEAMGLPRSPGPHADTPVAPGMLRILSPASAWLMNSSYGNDRGIGEKLGAAALILHPDDAALHGLVEGDPIVIANAGGELPLLATISDIAQPGMGIVYKSRWTGPASNNINLLVSNLKSDMAESTALHATEVTLRRA